MRERGLAAVLDYSGAHRQGPTDGRDASRSGGRACRGPRRGRRRSFWRASAGFANDPDVPARDPAPRRAGRRSPHGGYLRQRYVPLARVGICVPGGAAAYPSTVLMTAVPAQAAGVREIGRRRAADEVRRVQRGPARDLPRAGHQRSLSPRRGAGRGRAGLWRRGSAAVDKIVGPGNLFVALAKKHVFGDVDIDSIAGPSEVVVIADDTASPDFVAADLIAQAEHAPGCQCPDYLERTAAGRDVAARARASSWPRLDRGDLARESLERFGALILVRDADEACELANLIAPEHLHIATDECRGAAEQDSARRRGVPGPLQPGGAGRLRAGPSHVLPTGGTARFASGLSANDFLRRHSVIQFTEAGARRPSPTTSARLADKEGLTAHRASVDDAPA